MVGADAPQLVLGGIAAHAAEEDAHLGLPALQVGAQDRRLLLVRDLGRPEPLRAPHDPQLAFTRHAQVANPLRDAPGRNEIANTLVGEEIDGRGPPLAAGAAPHPQLPRAPHADPRPREQCDGRIADVSGEPTGTDVSGLCFAVGHAGDGIPASARRAPRRAARSPASLSRRRALPRAALLARGLARRSRRLGAEATRRVGEVLAHHVVVRLDLLAVERDRAGDAVTLVEIARREDVAVTDLRSGDREPVEREPDDRVDARVLNTAAQRVVVVLARDLRMAVAA